MVKDLKKLCIENVLNKQIEYENMNIPEELKEKIEETRLILPLQNLSADALCKKGCEDKNIALLILSHKELYEKLGAYSSTSIFWANELSRTGQASVNKSKSGEYFFDLGSSHKEIAKYILENPELNSRISQSQKEKLQEKITPMANECRNYGFI